MAKKQSKKKVAEEEQRGNWFVMAIVSMVIVGVIVFLLLNKQTAPPTVEEIIGEDINTDTLYEYNGFTFQKEGEFWKTQAYVNFRTADITLYYGPRELEDVDITYKKNNFSEKLFSTRKVVILVDPEAEHPEYVAIAGASMATSLTKLYGTSAVSACLSESPECVDKPVTSCEEITGGAIEIRDRPGPIEIVYEDNCLRVSAEGEDLVKAANKVLLGWYGIIE